MVAAEAGIAGKHDGDCLAALFSGCAGGFQRILDGIR